MGTIGHLLAWFAWPQNASLGGFILAVVTVTGGAASIGGLAGWYDLDGDRQKNLATLGFGFVGGTAGAWAGYLFGKWVCDGGTFGDATRLASVFGAVVGVNLLPPLVYVYWDRSGRDR